MKEQIQKKIREALDESKDSQKAAKIWNLKHIGYGNYKDRNGVIWKWNEQIKKMERTKHKEEDVSDKSIKADFSRIYDEVAKDYKGKKGSNDETNKQIDDMIAMEVILKMMKKYPQLKDKLLNK